MNTQSPKLPRSKMPHVGTTIFTEMSALASACGALNVAQGFPDLDTPEPLRAAVADAIEAGHNQYAPMAGNAQLRRWIAETYHHGAGYDADSEITIGAGASSVLFAAIAALVEPGDEVVLQDPCYDLYAPLVELHHGQVMRVPLTDSTCRSCGLSASSPVFLHGTFAQFSFWCSDSSSCESVGARA